jgi:hypothetical protein
MKNVLIDMTGQKSGKLTILEIAVRAHRNSQGHPIGTTWRCLCDCGKETIVEGKYLRSGRTKSCGCLRADSMRVLFRTHGETTGYKFTTPEYTAWTSMRGRCLNPNNGKYYCYGARGIEVCERWNSYENFLQDMGRKPGPGYSLDRINVNGNYEPSNCRWLGPKEQYWNRQGSLSQLFVDVARNRLPKELFDALWLESLKLQDEKTNESV